MKKVGKMTWMSTPISSMWATRPSTSSSSRRTRGGWLISSRTARFCSLPSTTQLRRVVVLKPARFASSSDMVTVTGMYFA